MQFRILVRYIEVYEIYTERYFGPIRVHPEKKAVPAARHADYRKWLLYYPDFQNKYSLPDSRSEHVRLFTKNCKTKSSRPSNKSRTGYRNLLSNLSLTELPHSVTERVPYRLKNKAFCKLPCLGISVINGPVIVKKYYRGETESQRKQGERRIGCFSDKKRRCACIPICDMEHKVPVQDVTMRLQCHRRIIILLRKVRQTYPLQMLA